MEGVVNISEPDTISKLYGLIASNSGTKTPEETEALYKALDELVWITRITNSTNSITKASHRYNQHSRELCNCPRTPEISFKDTNSTIKSTKRLKERIRGDLTQ